MARAIFTTYVAATAKRGPCIKVESNHMPRLFYSFDSSSETAVEAHKNAALDYLKLHAIAFGELVYAKNLNTTGYVFIATTV